MSVTEAISEGAITGHQDTGPDMGAAALAGKKTMKMSEISPDS